MKSKFATYTATLFAMFALGVSQANAQAKKGASKGTPAAADAKGKEAKEAPKRDTYPLYGKVVSITTKTLTIKGGEGKEDRKYSITADTQIVDGEKPAKIDAVKEGAWVGGLLKKAASGNDTVVKLNVGVKQKEDGAAKEEPKAKGKAK